MTEITFEMRSEIGESYKKWTPRSDPYKYADWANIFTPIEDNVWSDIRYLGLPFYPQFPVGRYFIDFADPVKKIGIEVDGKEFHQDTEKDMMRQEELESMGWTIIRIPGRKTFKERGDYLKDYEEAEMDSEEREQALAEYRTDSSEGILLELKKAKYSQTNEY